MSRTRIYPNPKTRHPVKPSAYPVPGVIGIHAPVYYPSLARFPGDPEAYAGSKQEIKAICAKRGLRCNGDVECDYLEVKDAPDRYECAPDVIEREVEKVVAREHGGKADAKTLTKLREAAAERLAGTQD